MEDTLDIRWKQRLSNFSKVLSQLDKAVQLSNQRQLSELERQGLIQSFEYTHELGWNVLRDYLKDQGTQQLFGSKDTVKEAFAVGLIHNGQDWMDMIRDRNRTSHTYNEEIAHSISEQIISVYIHRFNELEETLEAIADDANH